MHCKDNIQCYTVICGYTISSRRIKTRVKAFKKLEIFKMKIIISSMNKGT